MFTSGLTMPAEASLTVFLPSIKATHRALRLEAAKPSTAPIAAVNGVDIFFMGTNDLCSSFGIPSQLDYDLARKSYSFSTEETVERHSVAIIGCEFFNPRRRI